MSEKTPHQRLVHSLLPVVFSIAIVTILSVALISFSRSLYQFRDLHQDYLMAKSLVRGGNAYVPIPELWQQLFDEAPYQGNLKHLSPHLPFIILLWSPLALLPFHIASICWLLICISAYWIGAKLLSRHVTHSYSSTFIFSVIISSTACRDDLFHGQNNLIGFLCAVFAVLIFRNDQTAPETKASYTKRNQIILGVLLASWLFAKFGAIPLLFLITALGIRRVILSFFVAAAVYGALIFTFFDFNSLNALFKISLPAAKELYFNALGNLSVFSILTKLSTDYFLQRGATDRTAIFLASGASFDTTMTAIVSTSMGILIAFLIFYRALKCSTETASLRLVILTTIFSAVVWQHYLTPCLAPLIVLTHSYVNNKADQTALNLTSIIMLTLAVFLPWDLLAHSLYTASSEGTYPCTGVAWFYILPIFFCIFAASFAKVSPQRYHEAHTIK